jgi:hypothetical protein
MTRHGPIFNRRRPLPDRHQIHDLPAPVAIQVYPPGAADRTLRAKMLKQLFLKHAARLHK